MPPPKLSHETVRTAPKVLNVTFDGVWSHDTGLSVNDAFEALLKSESPRHVILDLRKMALADSEFISGLVLLKDRLAVGGGELVLFGLQPETHSILRLLSLDRLCPICADEAAALQRLGS